MLVTDQLLAILIVLVGCSMIQQAAYHRIVITELRRAQAELKSAQH